MILGIVGYGVVGQAMGRWLGRSSEHRVVIYDKFQPGYNAEEMRQQINQCELVFLCVPTPLGEDGSTCDLSAVEECAGWITAPMCIRSTVPPGTVDRLSGIAHGPIGFSPEYLGESAGHPWRQEHDCGFCIVGGPRVIFDLVNECVGSVSGVSAGGTHMHWTSARTAELCKYMENCFLATKVAFVNQFYDLAGSFGVDWEELRHLWLLDSRIGESHTKVSAERGFRGRCLPKDVAALISAASVFGGAPLLESVLSFNERVCATADSGGVAERLG